MKRFWKVFLFLLIALQIQVLCACKKTDDKIIKYTEIIGEVDCITKGEKLNLDVNFYYILRNVRHDVELTPVWTITDTKIARIEDNILYGVKEGSTLIGVYALEEEGYEYEFSLQVKKIDYGSVILSSKNNLTAGEATTLNVTSNVNKDIEISSSNKKVAIVENNTILALSEGSTRIIASIDGDEVASIDINVNKYTSSSIIASYEDYANKILNSMTLEEKVGQMFIGSTSGTDITTDIKSAIEDYHLGNFIYMGYNCTRALNTLNFSKELQTLFTKNNKGIPAFICIDQETGTVNRLNDGATRFLGNMAISATNNPKNSYLVGNAVGAELKHYGINFDLCPVLDVNNNPNNPIINCRSYGDNPIIVSQFGINMMNGLNDNNVMSCAKHFPGHGNTSTDSHYALPKISSSLDDLYSIELAPFISAIYNGIDAIMTTHIIFSAIDSKYPATLSKEVLTGLLRNSLGYDGLIITDGMQMAAITKNFGDNEAAILAINAGADMLCYTSLNAPIKAIKAVISAVNSGSIAIERINDAVKRILIKKIKYNLFNDYMPTSTVVYDVSSHEELNNKLARQAVTIYTNNFSGLDKNKSTVIMSSTSAYDLGYSNDENSFAYVCSKYMKENNMKVCDYQVISDMSSTNINTYLDKALEYEQIVIAIDSANSAQISFVNSLCSKRDDIIVIALKLPYDYNYYNNLNTFITIYDRTPVMIKALKELMNGEYIASGICPVKLNK